MEPYKYQRHRSQEAPSKCYQAPYSDCSSLPKYTITPNKEDPFSSRVKANSNLTRQNPTAVQDDNMPTDNSAYQDDMDQDYTSYPDNDMTSDYTSYPSDEMDADYTSYPDYTFPERSTSRTNQWNENNQMNQSTWNQMPMNNRMQGQMPMNEQMPMNNRMQGQMPMGEQMPMNNRMQGQMPMGEQMPMNNRMQGQMPMGEQMPMNNRMQGQMPPTSPLRMPTFSDDDTDYESDLAYIKQMYSSVVEGLLSRIQQEFDAVDYDESFIYDTFPDTITLLSMAEFILEQAQREGLSDTVESTQFRPGRPGQRPGFGQQDPWLRYLIETLVFNELLDRRRRRRHRNRRWY